MRAFPRGDSLAKAKVKNYESVGKSRLVADQVIASLDLSTMPMLCSARSA